MEIDTELQNLINEYVKQVENKEDDLVGLRRNINGIILVSKQELKNETSDLDKKFNLNEISEEEYLIKFRAVKEGILNKTKDKLNSLLVKYESVYNV
ncbi:MAG: hypothetical protein WCG28_01465 [bacterium]